MQDLREPHIFIYKHRKKLRLLWPVTRCRSSRLWDEECAERCSSKDSAARDRNICVINPSCVWDIRGRIRGTYLLYIYFFLDKITDDRCTSSCDVQEQSRKVQIRDFARKSWCVGVGRYIIEGVNGVRVAGPQNGHIFMGASVTWHLLQSVHGCYMGSVCCLLYLSATQLPSVKNLNQWNKFQTKLQEQTYNSLVVFTRNAWKAVYWENAFDLIVSMCEQCVRE